MADQLSFDEIEPTVFADAHRAEDLGWFGPQAQRLAGITYRQLDYWDRTSLVKPSLQEAAGSGSQRVYSYVDIILLRTVKRLLDAGMSLQNIRTAIDAVRGRGIEDLAPITLVSDGTTIYEVTNEEVVDLLQDGQRVFGGMIAFSTAIRDVDAQISQFPAASTELTKADGATKKTVIVAGGVDELAQRRNRRAAG